MIDEKAKRWGMRATAKGDVIAETVHKEWDDSPRESDLATNNSGLGLGKVYVLATDYDALKAEFDKYERLANGHLAQYYRARKCLDDLYGLVRKQGMDDDLRARIEDELEGVQP